MPSNLEDIGFEDIDSLDKLKGFVEHIRRNGTRKETRRGNNYYLFNPNENIEVWFFLDRAGNPAMTPFYAGRSRQEIKIIDAIINERDSPKIYSWVNPRGEDGGDTQVVFEVPDFWLMDFDRLGEMDKNRAQLTAFARDVKLYEDEKVFQNSKGNIGKTHPGRVIQYAANYFLPTGTFSNPMDSFAIFAGKVKEARQVRNDFAGGEFYYMIVNTYFGDLDLVCAKRAFERSPVPGNVIDGDFYISGKLILDE